MDIQCVLFIAGLLYVLIFAGLLLHRQLPRELVVGTCCLRCRFPSHLLLVRCSSTKEVLL